MNEWPGLARLIVSFLATYWLHSTILLVGCWLVTLPRWNASHFLRGRLWKLAAVLGLVTATWHVGLSTPTPLALTLPAPVPQVSALSDRLPATDQVLVTPTTPTIPPTHDRTGNLEPRRDETRMHRGASSNGGVASVVSVEPIPKAGSDVTGSSTLPVRSQSAKRGRDLENVIAEPRAGTAANHSTSSPNVIDPAHGPTGGMLPAVLPGIIEWIAGAGIVFFFWGGWLLAWQSWQLRRRIRNAVLIEEGAAWKTLNSFLRRHRIRKRIRLLRSSTECEPFAFGLFQGTIVLPEGIEERLRPEELSALLAHEVAHLVRGDLYWQYIGHLLCTSCVFQPLNLVARRQWQLAAEYLCDDWAVERGIRRMALAQCLLQIAESRVERAPRELSAAAAGAKATVVQRVARLLESQRPRDWFAGWVGRSLLHVLTILCLSGLLTLAPRVGLSLEQDGGEEIIQPVADLPPSAAAASGPWADLNAELRQLEGDLNRVADLIEASPRHRHLLTSVDDVRHGVASIRTRRENLDRHFRKEFDP